MSVERAPCPDCGELIVDGAKVCRFCGRGRGRRSLLWGDTRDGVQRLSNILACGLIAAVLVPFLGMLISWLVS